MAKLNELVYDVREAIKEFSDDTEVDDRYIIYLYNIKRSKYLRQDLNNFQKTTDLSIQQTFCLEMEEVSSALCNVGFICDKVMRSRKPVPKLIELHTNVALTRVKPTERTAVPFNLISISKVPYYAYAPYSESIYTFLDTDNHIYMVSKGTAHKLVNCISVTGIFENPLDLTDYSNCCGCNDAKPCFDEMETEYPLQPHYIDVIREEIIRDLLRTKQIPEDKTNDSNDGAR